MPSKLDQLIDELIEREGGFTDHPADRGGPTKFGITQKTLSRWLGRPATVDDVRNLSVTDAKAIYLAEYVPDLHHSNLLAQVFDFGVNSGPGTAIKELQRLVGAKDDGVAGPMTRAAVLQYVDLHGERVTVARYLARRLRFIARLISKDPTQRVFAAGWMNRCAEMLDLGMQ